MSNKKKWNGYPRNPDITTWHWFQRPDMTQAPGVAYHPPEIAYWDFIKERWWFAPTTYGDLGWISPEGAVEYYRYLGEAIPPEVT